MERETGVESGGKSCTLSKEEASGRTYFANTASLSFTNESMSADEEESSFPPGDGAAMID